MTIDVGEQPVGVAVNTLGEDHPVFITKLQANGAFAAAGLVSEGQEVVCINGEECEPLETADVIALLKAGDRFELEMRENPIGLKELTSAKSRTKGASTRRGQIGGGKSVKERTVACRIAVPSSADDWAGFGMEIEEKTWPPGLVVTSVSPGGAAEASGVGVGLMMVAVNKTDVRQMVHIEVVELMLAAEIAVEIGFVRPKGHGTGTLVDNAGPTLEQQKQLAELRKMFPRVRTHHLLATLTSATSFQLVVEILKEKHGAAGATTPSRGGGARSSAATTPSRGAAGRASTGPTSLGTRQPRQRAVRRLRLDGTIAGPADFGVQVAPAAGGLTVTAVVPKKLAATSGLVVGMEIISVNDGSGRASGTKACQGMPADSLHRFLMAAVASKVTHVDVAVKLPHSTASVRQTGGPPNPVQPESGAGIGRGQRSPSKARGNEREGGKQLNGYTQVSSKSLRKRQQQQEIVKQLVRPDNGIGAAPTDAPPAIIMQKNDAYMTASDTAVVPMEVNTLYSQFSPTQQQREDAAIESDYALASPQAALNARRQAANGGGSPQNGGGRYGGNQSGAVVRRIKIPSGSAPDYGFGLGHGPAGIPVTAVTPGKLADQHGISEGMTIVAINRASTRSMSKEAATQLLQNARGHVDVTVVLAPRPRADSSAALPLPPTSSRPTGGAMARATAIVCGGANGGPGMAVGAGPSMGGRSPQPRHHKYVNVPDMGQPSPTQPATTSVTQQPSSSLVAARMAAVNKVAVSGNDMARFDDDSSDEEFISIKRMYSVTDEQAGPARNGTLSGGASTLAPMATQHEAADDDENPYESISTIFTMTGGKTQASVEMSDDDDDFEA